MMKARWHEREHAWFRYWQSISFGALLRVSLAVFVTFSTFSFVSDLAVPRPSPYWWVLLWAGQWGTISTLYFLTATRWPKLLPAAVVVHLATMFVLFKLLPLYSTELPINTPLISLHQRQVLDGIIAMIVIVLGYGFFLYFMGTEGLRHYRLHTELLLAERLQKDLVPPVALKTEWIEVYGRTIPSGHVGGDLVDAVTDDRVLTCYVADVSGHGIAAGVLMGMVKSATRTILLRGESLPTLLTHLQCVLPGLKDPSQYVTFAALRFEANMASTDVGHRVECALAGHLPILHYQAQSRGVKRLGFPQFPLGLIPQATFESALLEVSSGDLLVVASDGFTEVTNHEQEEFGLDRLEQVLAHNASRSLGEIWEVVQRETTRYGDQQDDQTLMLVRVTA